MKTIEISYNPYKMLTRMTVDGIDVLQHNSYKKFKGFIEQGTPLQTWIEPINYLDWNGFVNEMADPEINDEISIIFSGRQIDFNDLKRSLKDQNEERSEKARIIFHFKHEKILDDFELSKNIEEVVKELHSDQFRELVEGRTSESLLKNYNDLEQDYKIAKEKEFYIVFAGVYSSGKSTLINTLIRHDVLPTSSRTCTSRNCRITHDDSLDNGISLTCYDENMNVVVEKRVYKNDSDCLRDFEEICPIDDVNENYADVETIELGVDLSHLYPKKFKKDKFKIVLIDTPGMDSAQSIINGQNKHAETALDAISSDSKPMIILCVDANKYEDKSIGEFMREIVWQSKEEGYGFNDRFLFLMNKSDSITYRPNESAEDAKSDFSEYLTDYTKWGVDADDEEMSSVAESASRFVPRVFMTAARIALAINCKAYNYTDEELNDPGKYDLLDNLESFQKRICGRRIFRNYYLSEYCDIPNYRKDKLKEEFEKALEDGDEIRATEIQCGIVSIETAIRDYIERYAYPVKVRDLLNTFEDILDDVKDFTGATMSKILQAEKELGEKKGEREGAKERKRSVEEKIAALEEAKVKISKQLEELDKIEFDSVSLHKAIADFKSDIDNDENIEFIRRNPKVKTGQKSRQEVEAYIQNLISEIGKLYKDAYTKTRAKLIEINKKHNEQIDDIFFILKKVISELEVAGVFEEGEYDFKSGVLWKMNFENISTKILLQRTRNAIVDKSTKRVKNERKTEWRSTWWNPFKFISSFIMSSYESVPVDGYFETKPIVDNITDYHYKLDNQSIETEDCFKKELQNSKTEVHLLINKLILELNSFLNDIKAEEEKIEKLGEDIGGLGNEIKKYKDILIWLNGLKKKIEGV